MIDSTPIRLFKGIGFQGFWTRQSVKGLAFAASILTIPALAGPKRCDWHGPKSAGEVTYKKCVDFAAMEGKSINVPKNVSRISVDGISFCSGTFSQAGAGNADIVFIYDNSGSMAAKSAYVDAAIKDTLFYYNNDSTKCKLRGSLTYQTQVGSRTVPTYSTGSCNTNLSGDPYYARGQVIQKAIDFLVTTSPTSTAGAVSFSSEIANMQPPLPLNLAGNADKVKNSIVVEDLSNTKYGPPLLQAKAWLSDPAIIKTQRQAIIFISDGAPKDVDGTSSYLNITGLPPVYSIYLGDVTTPDTLKLKELSDRTGGTFTRVNPRKVTEIHAVMTEILKSITSTTVPKSVTVSNSSLVPPQTSHSTAVTLNADGSQGVTLDSIIGLHTGSNAIHINVVKADNNQVNYTFTINVSGAEITASGGNYTCWDKPTLTAVDQGGAIPEIYEPDTTGYTLRLTRSTSELRNVSVAATTESGDKESIALGTPTSPLGFPTQSGPFKFNPNDGTPTLNNQILEVDKNGMLSFTWSHPRDSQETVSYFLPGRIVPTVENDVLLDIKEPVTHGEDIAPHKLENPVIIVDSKDACLANCTGTQVFWAQPNIPTWNLAIRSPITYTIQVFDNLGQSVASGRGEITLATWNAMAKSGDSAKIQFKLPPLAKNGEILATGVYVMRALITGKGDQVTKNSAGELVKVKNSKREYLKRFGYVRK